MKVPYRFAPPHLNRQRAAAVGTLAMRYLREGRTETAAEHEPDYLVLFRLNGNGQNEKGKICKKIKKGLFSENRRESKRRTDRCKDGM